MFSFDARLRVAAACVVLGLAACSGGGTPQIVGGAPTPSPSPSPTAAAHLYAEFTTTQGSAYATGLAVYRLPLGAGATPSLTLTGTFGPLAIDGRGDLYTSIFSELDTYTAPLSATSVATKVLTKGPATIPTSANDIAFDQVGDLWMETSYDLREFPAPISASSTAATVVSGGGLVQLSFSPSGQLYAGPLAPTFGSPISLRTYGSYPYTTPKSIPGVTFGAPIGWMPDGSALVATNGYQSGTTFVPPGLEIVQAPLGAGSPVAFDLPFALYSGQNAAHTAAVDADGTTYAISAASGNALRVYAYPLSATSVPQMTLKCVTTSSGCYAPSAVYLGP